ncbi:thiamine kinase [Photobacterium aphoticum]|uniref:Aminoglycoside phosphotransferase domain-containing protein n=1 Tax=Photobacterium aphoticum TaxID=754436 RepID=A0A0J1GN81_9GAMM|nr:hypothetical protein ABT58_09725 [Photobacterium aphoticum]PSU57616.1 hypothetical protein C9I90_09020 [Photobacterium aphoticum]GHA37653.1 thiamine kinase [Photobacterium aphoticum]
MEVARSSSQAALKAQLHRLWPDYQVIDATPLSGGLSNRCWRVTLQHRQTQSQKQAQTQTSAVQTCVWRPSSAASTAFGVNREQEYQLLALLNQTLLHQTETSSAAPSFHSLTQRISPAPFLYHQEGALVTWVDGETAPYDLPMATLLRVQAQIHALPVPDWALDCRQRARHYWAYMAESDKTPALTALYQHFQTVRTLPSQTKTFPAACCHHDLGAYNLIHRLDGGYTVIDWEYAAAGDPSLDLAMTISANQWSPQSAVTVYCQQRAQLGLDALASPQTWLAAVQAWLPWCDYLAMLWYYVGAQQWDNDDYRVQAKWLQQKLLHPAV